MNPTFIRLGFRLARLYWWCTKPLSMGVAALVLNNSGQVLLVKNTYRKGWYLPGGGVNKKETVLEAIKRELAEEVNITCHKEPKLYSGPYLSGIDHKSNHTLVFLVDEWVQTEPFPESPEIEDMQFFDCNLLPENTTPGTKRRIEEYIKKIDGGFRW